MGGMWQKKGFTPPAEGPSLWHRAECPHPGSHTRLNCKRQVTATPSSPQSRPRGEEI